MSAEYIEHATLVGDRWDLLAHRYYGDAMAMDVVLSANPDHAHLLVLPAGLTLRIPLVEAVAPSVQEPEGGLPWL